MIRLAHSRDLGVELKLRHESRAVRGRIDDVLANGFILTEPEGLPNQVAYEAVERVGLDFDDAAAFAGYA